MGWIIHNTPDGKGEVLTRGGYGEDIIVRQKGRKDTEVRFTWELMVEIVGDGIRDQMIARLEDMDPNEVITRALQSEEPKDG